MAKSYALLLVVALLAAAGPGRILFGSDSTYLSPGAHLAKIAFADIGEEAKKQILASNARRVFGKSVTTGKA